MYEALSTMPSMGQIHRWLFQEDLLVRKTISLYLLGSALTFAFVALPAKAEDLNVTATGVGIGTAEPNVPLEVIPNTYGEALRVHSVSPYGVGLVGGRTMLYADNANSSATIGI